MRRPGGALLAGLAYVATPVILLWIGQDFLTGTFGNLTTSSYFAPILFGLGAINLAQNPDGILALVGSQRRDRAVARRRKAELEAAASGLRAGCAGGPGHPRRSGPRRRAATPPTWRRPR